MILYTKMHRRVFSDVSSELDADAQGRSRTLGPLVLIPTADVLPRDDAVFTPSADVLAGVVKNPAKWLPLGPVFPTFRRQYVAFVHEDSAVRVRNGGDFRELRAVDGGVTATDFIPAVCQPDETLGLVWAPLTMPAREQSCHHSVHHGDAVLHRRHVLIDNWWSESAHGCLDVIPAEECQRLLALGQLHSRGKFAGDTPATQTQQRIQSEELKQAEQLRTLAKRRKLADQRYQSSGVTPLMIALVIMSLLGVVALFFFMTFEYKNENVEVDAVTPGAG